MRARLAGFVLLLALGAAPALAQCALCYQSAANAGKEGQKTINRAVLVLLVPPLGMMVGLFTLAVRYKGKNERHQPESQPRS